MPWAQVALGVESLWGITEGAGVTVAVVDTGFTAGSAQLRAIRTAPGANSAGEAAGYTADCGGVARQNSDDSRGHGTDVASIIAAPRVAGVEFHGIAPQATIMPVKSDPDGAAPETTDSIAHGILDALKDKAVRVINISSVARRSAALDAAVARAAAADVVIVAATGNDATDKTRGAVSYPAAYAGTGRTCTNVISVGAIDSTGELAAFSNASSHTTVVAPGVDVRAAGPGGRFRGVSGTSFAAPFVSGAVALLRAAQPGLSARQVCRQLERTATPPAASVPDPGYGFGTVDPVLAVTTPFADSADVAGASAQPVPLPAAAASADRSLQHRSVLVAGLLIGLAVLAVLAAGLSRRARRLPSPRR